LARTGHRAEARQEFTTIIDRYPGAASEGGLPLDFLAHAHTQPRGEFVRYAIEHPSAVTPQILAELSDAEKLETALIRTSWAQDEELRRIAAAARSLFRTNQSPTVWTFRNKSERAEAYVEAPPMFWV